MSQLPLLSINARLIDFRKSQSVEWIKLNLFFLMNKKDSNIPSWMLSKDLAQYFYYPANYYPVIWKVSTSWRWWIYLPLSFTGINVNVIKLNALPKLRHLFQSIPLLTPLKFFQYNMKKPLANFFWNSRHPRLCLTLLYLTFDRGSLKVPLKCHLTNWEINTMFGSSTSLNPYSCAVLLAQSKSNHYITL